MKKTSTFDLSSTEAYNYYHNQQEARKRINNIRIQKLRNKQEAKQTLDSFEEKYKKEKDVLMKKYEAASKDYDDIMHVYHQNKIAADLCNRLCDEARVREFTADRGLFLCVLMC